jgi:hypothetical protein
MNGDQSAQLSKKERRELRRQQKEQERSSHLRQVKLQKLKKVSVWLLVGAFIIVGLGWYLARPRPGQPVPNLGNAHIASVDSPHAPYNSIPPTSGPHLGNIAPWGISDGPIPDESQIHNLEDGGVMVQYWCGDGTDQLSGLDYQAGCPELVDQLSAIVSGYHSEVILAPYPGLDARIALTAWNRIDKFDEFDEQRIRQFINAYRGIDHHVRTGLPTVGR